NRGRRHPGARRLEKFPSFHRLSPPYRPLAIFSIAARRTLHGVLLFATHEGAIGAFGEEVDSYRRGRRRRIRASAARHARREITRAFQARYARAMSSATTIAHEVSIEGQLRHLPPEVLVVAEGEQRLPHLLEIGVGLRHFGVDIERRSQRG